MISTLFGKIFFLIFFTVSLIFIVFTYQFTSLQKKSILDSEKIKAKSMIENIIIVNQDAMLIDDKVYLLESLQDFVSLNSQVKSVTFNKKDGLSFIVHKTNWKVLEQTDNVNKELLQKESFEIKEYKSLKENVSFYQYPVFFVDVFWGNFRIELYLKDYNKQLKSLQKQSVFLGLFLLVFSLLISYFIAKMISEPIVKLSIISEEIADGDLSKRVKINSKDEIGRLAKSFNSMVSSLESSQKSLRSSRDELEERVKLRTLELKELNENLELRVTKEIIKRQEQEQLLIYQSKLASMGEMIGNIAHQWRQPLNTLGLVIQNIQLSYELGELDKPFMDKSVEKVKLLLNNMSKTIDDFRNFFKPNKEKENFILNDYVDKALSLVDSSFMHYSIKIQKEYSKQVVVYGFPNEFSQTVLNILNNAKDALLENSINNAQITISLFKEDKYGVVSIKDNAGGVPYEILEKIFEPYFTTKKQGSGTGIGLYMSKIIIEQNMSGKLIVKNEYDGAKFSIKVPLNKIN